ncbi:dihydropteroate synthase [Niveispirillum sp. KHB5.9]
MGIVNVTPDSFSDGGDHAQADAAIAHGRRLLAEGADILDIGGESTRPGAAPVPVEAEIARVVPVIRALAAEGAVISIDTSHAAVMQAAAEAGAMIINDVTALTGDPDSLSVAAATGLPLVLMHIKGEPQTMQDAPHYDDVGREVHDFLSARIDAAMAAGIAREKIAIDPGIGFGKGLSHNVDLLARVGLLHNMGCPILIGVSRKRFIAGLSKGEAPKDRVAGSIATALHTLAQGAHILRVHDVAATVQAVAVWQALQSA